MNNKYVYAYMHYLLHVNITLFMIKQLNLINNRCSNIDSLLIFSPRTVFTIHYSIDLFILHILHACKDI